MSRETLYLRINKRVDISGLFNEVQHLVEQGFEASHAPLGIKSLYPLLRKYKHGKCREIKTAFSTIC